MHTSDLLEHGHRRTIRLKGAVDVALAVRKSALVVLVVQVKSAQHAELTRTLALKPCCLGPCKMEKYAESFIH